MNEPAVGQAKCAIEEPWTAHENPIAYHYKTHVTSLNLNPNKLAQIQENLLQRPEATVSSMNNYYGEIMILREFVLSSADWAPLHVCSSLVPVVYQSNL